MSGKDWPNLGRMFIALMLLIVSPLAGIAVGAVCWSSLERGLLAFSVLGLVGFALATRPFWRGNRARIRSLLISGASLGISALLDILTGRPAALAVYFSAMVECFSLIPWITAILQEIHQGRWRGRGGSAAAPPPRFYPSAGRTAPTPEVRPARKSRRPEPEGPELPIPGVPRWVLLLGGALLALVIGLLLWSAAAGTAPTKQTRAGKPGPLPAAVPPETALPAPAPEPEISFPFLAAENERWMVYVDHFEQGQRDAFLEFSVYDKEGNLFQSLSMTSPFLRFQDNSFSAGGGLICFQDLNFDGLPDLLALYENVRNGAYDAFLWDEEKGQFVEEPSFTEITGPCDINEDEMLVFGCGSGSASSIGWSVHRYVPGEGYRLEYTLKVFSVDDPEYPGLHIETHYENGEAVSAIESWDGSGLSDIWDRRTHTQTFPSPYI